jgi:hypothetical protein
MNENENEIIDSQNDETEEIDLDLSDDTEEKEDVEALKKDIATLKAQKEHWKKKANEKGIDKEDKKEVTKESNDLSTKDTLALMEAKISADDFDEVVDFANYRKVSVMEALKSPTLRTILADRMEQRQTAEATQTKSARTSPKITSDALIERARNNQLPDDANDISKLAEARMAKKLGN